MRNHKRHLGILTASSLLLFGALAPASAQTPLVTLTGDASYEFFGHSVSAAGDVDADGVPDFVVGSNIKTGASDGRVWIYSGATHQLLHTLVGTPGADFRDSSAAPAGDFNLDGHDDVLVGAPTRAGGNGAALIVSGLDGSVLHTFFGLAFDYFGGEVANAGDVNGDGRLDLIIGAPGRSVGVTNVGAAEVYSGADGSRLHTFVGCCHNSFFGSAVKGIGDVDGDGYDDVAIGEPYSNSWGFLHVISGFDGSSIRVHVGDSGFRLGRIVAALGDVNGDAVPDYAAGSPFSPVGNNSGLVRVYSGLDGAVLYEIAAQAAGYFFGSAIDAAGDIDGDAVTDLVIGAALPEGYTIGRAEIRSGANGSLLQSFSNDMPGDGFGKSVAGVGDTNGDGVADVLIGFNGSSKSVYWTGAVRLYSGLDSAPWFPYCDALPNSSTYEAALGFVGSPSLSKANLDLIVTSGVKDKVGIFIYGPAKQQVPFGNGNLCVGAGGVGIFRLPPFVFDPFGFVGASLNFSQPPLGGGPGKITPGSTWNFQAVFRDAPAGGAGFNLSNALSATFLP